MQENITTFSARQNITNFLLGRPGPSFETRCIIFLKMYLCSSIDNL